MDTKQQQRATLLRKFHATASVVWALMIVPTILWWHDSVLWVALISVYALVVSHWAAWQASRAETNGNKENEES